MIPRYSRPELATLWEDKYRFELWLEIELAGGHRLRITGPYDPDALARLIRGLSS